MKNVDNPRFALTDTASGTATTGDRSTEQVGFTPGKWLTHWDMGSGDFHWIVCSNDPNNRIAKVETFAPTDGDMEAQGRANARLIASAPCMYAALKDLVGCLGDGGYFPTAGKTKTDAARAALAKAEGRQS